MFFLLDFMTFTKEYFKEECTLLFRKECNLNAFKSTFHNFLRFGFAFCHALENAIGKLCKLRIHISKKVMWEYAVSNINHPQKKSWMRKSAR